MQYETAAGDEDHIILRKRRKPPSAPKAAENGVQIAIKNRLIFHGVEVVFVKNEAQRTHAGHKLAKKMGLKAKFPDLMLLPGNGRVGFIECKHEGWKPPTDAAKGEKAEHWRQQREMHEHLRSRGYQVAVCTSQDEAVDALKAWGWLRG